MDIYFEHPTTKEITCTLMPIELIQHSKLLYNQLIMIYDNEITYYDLCHTKTIDKLYLIYDVNILTLYNTNNTRNIFNMFNVQPTIFIQICDFLNYILFDYSINFISNISQMETLKNYFYGKYVIYCTSNKIILDNHLIDDNNCLNHYINCDYDMLIQHCDVKLLETLIKSCNFIDVSNVYDINLYYINIYNIDVSDELYKNDIKYLLYLVIKYDREDLFSYIISNICYVNLSNDTYFCDYYMRHCEGYICKLVKKFNNKLTNIIKKTLLYNLIINTCNRYIQQSAYNDSNYDMQELLCFDVDINAVNSNGISALFYTIAYNNYEGTKLLLNNGANIYLKTNRGKNIFNFSSNKISKEIYSLFTQYELNTIKHL